MAGPFDDLIPGNKQAQQNPFQITQPQTPAQIIQQQAAQQGMVHTGQEIQQTAATMGANEQKAKAEAASAQIAAKTAQEAYDSAHPKGSDATVLGPDSLKNLSAPDQELVKALAEGRLAFPGGFALKAPWWQQKLEQVAAYDPTFDATNFNNRAKARAMLLTGKVGASANALNTAIGHLGLLNQQVSGTASHDVHAVNSIENYVSQNLLGDPGITNFKDTAGKLASELTSVYRNGGGAEQDVIRQLQSLDPNASQAQKTAVIRNALDLLASKQAANLYQYGIGSGGKPPVDLLDPDARAVLDQFPNIRDKHFAVQSPGLSQAAAALIQSNGGLPPPSGGDGFTPPPTGPTNGGMGPSSDGYSETPDPQSADFWNSAIKSGVPYRAALQQWQQDTKARGLVGVTPPPPDAYNKAASYVRDHPNADYTPVNSIQRKPVSPFQQGMTDATFSGPGAFLANTANSAIADIPSALAGNQGAYFQAVSQAQHPTASTLGDVLGATGAMLGGEAALGGKVGAGLGRELLANNIYGGVRGAADNPNSPVSGSLEGLLASTGGTLIGSGLTRGISAAARGIGAPDIAALSNGGSLTLGQMLSQSGTAGKAVKGIEDRLAGFPGIGDVINTRRMESVKAFNSQAFDHALQPIGATVNGATGEAAVQNAHQAVSNAFSAALKGKSAVPDDQFITSAQGPLQRLAAIKRNGIGPEIVGQIEESTKDLFDPATGAISGENMQSFLQALRQIRQGYKNDPLYSTTIKPSVQGLESAVEGMFQRQAPEVMPQYNAAKAAYRRLSVLADAVNKGKNTEGVFSPSQLGLADRSNAIKYNGAIPAASGDSPFFDLQRAGQKVLPSKVPDSGTAGRLALMAGAGSLPVAGAGLGYAAGDTQTGAEGGIGLAGVLAMAYSKRGQQLFAKALLARNPQLKALADKLSKLSPYAGAATAGYLQPPAQ